MKKNRTWVALAENEWGQVVDGLICRAELYEETVRYYESGHAEGEIAEVRDEDEARDLAQLYRRIICKIEKARASDFGAGPRKNRGAKR